MGEGDEGRGGEEARGRRKRKRQRGKERGREGEDKTVLFFLKNYLEVQSLASTESTSSLNYYYSTYMYMAYNCMGTFRPKSTQGNTTNLNISFSMDKKAAQVGIKPTTYCLQGRCSTN